MLLAITWLSAFAILIKGLFFTINNMSRLTCQPVRISWLAMTTGALGILIAPLYDRPYSPTFWETVLIVGLALYVVFERRRPEHFRGMS